MNFTRMLGQNNRVYRKFGEYCISEANNECFIICCFCQDEHQSEMDFWAHIQELHDYTPPSHLQSMQEALQKKSKPQIYTQPVSKRAVTQNVPTYVEERPKLEEQSQGKPVCAEEKDNNERNQGEPMYIEAEYLEGIDLNDPSALLELDGVGAELFGVKTDHEITKTNEIQHEITQSKAENCDYNIDNKPTTFISSTMDARTHRNNKYIDIEKIASKHLQNTKVVKSLFLQMHRINNEFKYKINKLTQAVRILEQEMRRDPNHLRKRFMKIFPDEPLTSRDEILILDEELHKSKEMRDCLHDEALAIVAENTDTYCRGLWRMIMTDAVSNQFCWRGVTDGDKVIKYPIRNLTIADVFQAAFREKFPSQPSNYFKERTMTYFNKALERIKRRTFVESKQLSNCSGNRARSEDGDFRNDVNIKQNEDNRSKRKKSDEVDYYEDEQSIDDTFEEVFC